MAEPTFATGLSPLDQIRLAEAEVTRKIVAACEASEHAITEAHAQATLLKKPAHDSGACAGQIRYKEIVSRAEEEARTIVEHAHHQADELQWNGQIRMEGAIREAIDIVLCLKGGGNQMNLKMIPIEIVGLKTERDFIQMALDERERADHFRLKLVKRSLEKKRAMDKPQ